MITFLSFPQLFRRVAAALPGMESTQDRSREDSILPILSENVITGLENPTRLAKHYCILQPGIDDLGAQKHRFSIANEIWLSKHTHPLYLPLITVTREFVFACLIFNEQETLRIPVFCLIFSPIGFVYVPHSICFLTLFFLIFKLSTQHRQEITQFGALSWSLFSEQHNKTSNIISKDFKF